MSILKRHFQIFWRIEKTKKNHIFTIDNTNAFKKPSQLFAVGGNAQLWNFHLRNFHLWNEFWCKCWSWEYLFWYLLGPEVPPTFDLEENEVLKQRKQDSETTSLLARIFSLFFYQFSAFFSLFNMRMQRLYSQMVISTSCCLIYSQSFPFKIWEWM